MSATTLDAAGLLGRLDRLPVTRFMWTMVVLLSLGGMFEFYDLFMTAYVIPGLVKAGLLKGVGFEVFGGLAFQGPALFVASTFSGLFIGTIVFGFAADRYGRRSVFTISMLWYCAATLVMAFQDTGLGVVVWRLIAGIGLGVELVTIDTYIAELVPPGSRARAFAINQTIQFAVVPIVALLAFLLVPIQVFGLDGWRWVAIIGAVGAIFVWFLRLGVPESPRWLVNRGRFAEADRVTAMIERRVQADLGGAALPPPLPAVTPVRAEAGRFSDIWRTPYRARTIMLMVFQFFQTFGFYGFSAWVPTLIATQTGIDLRTSLLYGFVIAIANPFGPLLASLFAHRFELKWQLVGAAIGVGVFGMLFSQQTAFGLLILFGVLITLCNNILSYAFHGYQAELFPTRVRARAIGFTYAFSRLSVVFASFVIASLLNWGGTPAVFGLIAFAMAMVVISIGGFGPRTRNLRLEEIAA